MGLGKDTYTAKILKEFIDRVDARAGSVESPHRDAMTRILAEIERADDGGDEELGFSKWYQPDAEPDHTWWVSCAQGEGCYAELERPSLRVVLDATTCDGSGKACPRCNLLLLIHSAQLDDERLWFWIRDLGDELGAYETTPESVTEAYKGIWEAADEMERFINEGATVPAEKLKDWLDAMADAACEIDTLARVVYRVRQEP